MFLPDDPHDMWPLFQRVPAYGPRWSPISALLGKEEDEPLYNAFAQAWHRRATRGPQSALVNRLVRWTAERAGVPADTSPH